MIMPTPMRKYGTKRALPTKSMWFISGPAGGISRLRASPTKNAPKMPSIPTHSIKPAPRKTSVNTKMYCTTLSSKRRKKRRQIHGNTTTMPALSANSRAPSSRKLKPSPSGL